jgi:hypothetical protein
MLTDSPKSTTATTQSIVAVIWVSAQSFRLLGTVSRERIPGNRRPKWLGKPIEGYRIGAG